ncbi:hypothetical protein PCASD_01411 [Puccinia coronata f. sp. avenae]|jgi:hypothetical protein|uniref:Uncharacterized protein n=1 Tax=Puccinia coronata f. sp. avenae TaxID=200324 RepID=A0A2N5VKK6_9BASI|nr:hypothetical protein PCASD_01411 [Puccinia coronata f. sp. avenae]
MVQEAPARPSCKEEVQKIPESQGSSIIKKFKEKICNGPGSNKKIAHGQNPRPDPIEPKLPSRARKTVDRFCQAHGFSNPLEENLTGPGMKKGDDQKRK